MLESIGWILLFLAPVIVFIAMARLNIKQRGEIHQLWAAMQSIELETERLVKDIYENIDTMRHDINELRKAETLISTEVEKIIRERR